MQYVYRKSLQALTRCNGISKRPRRVILEATNACNARCATCPRQYLTRSLGFMEMGLFKRCVTECARWDVADICLSNFGEALLDRSIFEKVAYVKGAGIPYVRIFTNGALLDESACNRLLNPGLDELEASVDGFSDEVYGIIRPPLQLERVKSNILRFTALNLRRNPKRTSTALNYVITDMNRHEYPQFASFWRQYVDRIDSVDANYWGGALKNKIGTKRPSVNSESYFPCYRLWSELTVLWDGRVSMCCQDFNGEIILGDANDQSLDEIWRGPKITELREKHRASRLGDIPLCKNCLIGREPLGWFHHFFT